MSRPEPRRRRIGPLEVIEIHHSPAAPYVVLFHGFGADMTDLAPLSQVISVGRPVNWIFPNGHIRAELGAHVSGRAWFPLPLAELQAAMATGSGIDLTTVTPPGMKRACEAAAEMLAALDTDMSRIVIGGFSQGAMLATEVTLRAAAAPAGLALLSTTLVDSENWKRLAPARKGLRFFQSHGTHDSVLAIEPAQRLEILLREAGLQGKLVTFHGGHEIPSEVLIQLGSFLRETLPR